ALELGSNEAIKEAVLRGVGAAVLSRQTIRKEVRSGQLHGLKVAGLCLKRDIYVVWDRRRALPIAARLFLDALDPGPGKP
ncbi:MAG TPA: LysR substrate-binding domain-containing protein, partial [Gemmataceae bacterium]|nr:LysR substrate-binding domain-containing protein [Gemmataceae bacterium]